MYLKAGGGLSVNGKAVIHAGNISSQSVNYANYLAQIIAEDKLPPRFRAYGQNTSDHRNVDTTCLENGFYWVNAGTLPPNVGDADIITVNANSSYGHQLAFKFSGGGTTGSSYDGKDLYTRIYSGGSWLPWYTILTSGNYTAYAAPASHSHSYLPLSGGWMNTTAQIGCYTTSKGSSDVYNGGIQLREATGSTTSCTDNMYDAPGITFHWGGWWVHKLNMHSGTLYWDNTKVLLNGDNISWSNVTGKPTILTMGSDGRYSLGAGGSLGGSNGGLNTLLVGDDAWLGDCNAAGIVGVRANNSTSQAGFYFYGSNANLLSTMIATSGAATFSGSVYSNSDRHLKKSISSIPASSLERLFNVSDKLLKKYILKQTGKESYGFVAQELEKYIPEAVNTNEASGIKSVSYDVAYAKILASMIQEIKVLKKQLEVMNI